MEFNGKVPRNSMETTAMISMEFYEIHRNQTMKLEYHIELHAYVNEIYVFTIFHRFRCHCKLLDKFTVITQKTAQSLLKSYEYKLVKLNEIKTHSQQQNAQTYIDKLLMTDSQSDYGRDS